MMRSAGDCMVETYIVGLGLFFKCENEGKRSLRRLFVLSERRLSFSSYEETTITFRTADLSPKCSWILCSYRKMEVFVIVTNNNIPICHWGTLEDIQFRGTTRQRG